MLASLSKVDIDWATDVAEALNYLGRRDKALAAIITSNCKLEASSVGLPKLLDIHGKISNRSLQEDTLLSILYKAAEEKDGYSQLKSRLQVVIDKIAGFDHSVDRSRAYCVLISIVIKSVGASSLTESLHGRLQDTLDAMDLGWLKIQTAYNIVASVAEHSPEKARIYLERTESLKADMPMNDATTGYTYVFCLRLAIRAFIGLLPRENESEGDLANLKRLIEQIPSYGLQAQLLSELSCGYYLSRRSEEADKIVAGEVKSLIYRISEHDKDFRDFIVIKCSPALFRNHRATANDLIQTLNLERRDAALSAVCDFILRKVLPDDPFEGLPGYDYKVSAEEVRDLCELLQLMAADSVIYGYIEKIVDTVVSAQRTSRYSKQQVDDIENALQNIASTKFQGLFCISHEGYRIITQAQLYRISQPIWPIWE